MSNEPSTKRSSDEHKVAFHRVFPELVKELTEDGLKDPEISDGIQHLKDVSVYELIWDIMCEDLSPSMSR